MKNKIKLVDKKIYVSHGKVTHPIGEECKSCEESLREFEKDLASGEVARKLSAIKQPTTEGKI